MPLLTRLNQGSVDLEFVVNEISQLSGKNIPTKTKDFYSGFLALSQELKKAANLILARESSSKQILSLSKPVRHCQENAENILCGDESLPYWHVRLSAFQAYVSCTWALYDTITKVCGLLILEDTYAKNPTFSHKLPQIFHSKNEAKLLGIGFNFASQIKESYGWPIALSYACRNWLLHEGHAQNSVSFFQDSDRTATVQRISLDAFKAVTDRCTEYGVQDTLTMRDSFPDPKSDLMTCLQVCHEEIDECLSILVAWSCSSAKNQAILLLERHRA